MADIKISALTALTGDNTVTDDEYVIVDKSVPETKKQTRAELFKNIPAAKFASSFALTPPIIFTSNYTVGDNDTFIISSRAATNTVTLPSNSPGRVLFILNVQPYTVISASNNIFPRVGSVSGSNAILPATDGSWVMLVSYVADEWQNNGE